MFIEQLPKLHKQLILSWKEAGISPSEQDGVLKLIEENHAFNYQLWHAEDRARRDDQGAQFVYEAKREIDHCNQQRNNRMEAIDQWFHQELKPANPKACPIHSETPGMMIDRLSILALKAFHMELQTLRTDVEPHHRQSCQEKLTVIHIQQQILHNCLAQLINEVLAKTRTFCIYHQFKMYNDPTLNPELYGS